MSLCHQINHTKMHSRSSSLMQKNTKYLQQINYRHFILIIKMFLQCDPDTFFKMSINQFYKMYRVHAPISSCMKHYRIEERTSPSSVAPFQVPPSPLTTDSFQWSFSRISNDIQAYTSVSLLGQLFYNLVFPPSYYLLRFLEC